MASIYQFPKNVVGAKSARLAMIERGKYVQAAKNEIEHACTVAVHYIATGMSTAAAVQMGYQSFKHARPVSQGGYAA